MKRRKPKRNPVTDRYIVCAYKGGMRLHYNGVKFTTRGRAKRYETQTSADGAVNFLLRAHPMLRSYRLKTEKLARPKLDDFKANPSGYRRALESYAKGIDDAEALLYDFSGQSAKKKFRVNKSAIKAGLVVGKLEGVLYSTDRGEGTEKFLHRFRKKSRPLLISKHDGSQIDIVGGRYRFTKKGIEDR